MLTQHEGTISLDFAPSDMPLSIAEAGEFARALGLPADSPDIRPTLGRPAACEKGATYEQLVADPIKSLVSSGSTYFLKLKIDLIVDVAIRTFGHVNCHTRRVLDVGCGTGDMMRGLRPFFDEVWGCDVSRGMTRRAGEQALTMPTATQIPAADETFDLAVCACVYHHLEPGIRSDHLREIFRVLRPGGLFMMFEHNPRNPITRLIVRRCPIDAAAILLPAHEARGLIQSVGFEQTRTRYYLHFPQQMHRWLGWSERLLQVTALGGQYCSMGRKPERG